MTSPAQERLQLLKGYLEFDQNNPALLSDVAQAALDADECDYAVECFTALDQMRGLAVDEANLAGIAAMRSARQKEAQKWFGQALKSAPDDHDLRFNLAWSHALAGDLERSAELLESELIDALPQAAMLDMQIDHELGRFEDAGKKMDVYLAQHPDYAPLQAAASVLAMDLGRPDLAREAALRAGSHPDALTTLASFELADQNIEAAEALYRKALETQHTNPRAEIGVGLVALANGDHADAARKLDKGADKFGDHLGSWIAAGWAYVLAGDADTARLRFERAIEIDDSFGEAHGSLAVIDLLAGDIRSAQRRAEIAVRLDPSSFSGALAKVLLAEASGKPGLAKKILEGAMATPILPDGKTLKEAIVASIAANNSRPAI